MSLRRSLKSASVSSNRSLPGSLESTSSTPSLPNSNVVVPLDTIKLSGANGTLPDTLKSWSSPNGANGAANQTEDFTPVPSERLEEPPIKDALDSFDPEPLHEKPSKWMEAVGSMQSRMHDFARQHRGLLRMLLGVLAVCVLHVYVGQKPYLCILLACVHDLKKARFVLAFLMITWIVVLYKWVFSPYILPVLFENVLRPFLKATRPLRENSIFQAVFALLIFAVILTFILVDTWKEKERLTGIGGMAFFIILMFALSTDRFKIRWRPVLCGFLLQFVLGLLVLRWQTGASAFSWFTDQIVTFLDYTQNGTVFVYGFLAKPPNICGMEGVFAFTFLQVIIYFGSIVALLYYYGVMQFVLKRMAWFMQKTLGTTASESFNACACVFLGQSEAPLLIRPYLSKMTLSELHAVMTSGFSCIAGSLFAAYISFGACPSYLLSATVMSAPGSLACSKILYPETEESHLKDVADLELPKGEESSALECISNGAVSAVELVFAIIANLIVFLALLAFIDNIFDYVGHLIGHDGWTFQLMLGYICFPLAYLMGVTSSPEETLRVGQLMGTKTALNEFIAYQQLGRYVAASPPQLSPRSAMIATYALCGFSNFASVGIQLGILGGMVPERKGTLAKLSMRALLGGCICCFYTAALAGVLVDTPVHCLPYTGNADCFNVTYYQELLQTTTTLSPTSDPFNSTIKMEL